jgi:hypothetical protein
MKRIIVILLLTLPLFAACAHLEESNEVNPIVHGTWIGNGRFYDRHLNDEYGKLWVQIEIHPDNSVSGTVGGATLAKGTVTSRPNDFLIEAGTVPFCGLSQDHPVMEALSAPSSSGGPASS